MEEVELTNGEVHIREVLSVREQVKRAYADSNPSTYRENQRCLNFLISEWVSSNKAAKLLSDIGNYGNFSPVKTSQKLGKVRAQTDHCRVAIGREGSPVIYFEVGDRQPVDDAFGDYADEYSEAKPPDISRRLRYQGNEKLSEHHMCRHDTPPVPIGQEAQGDPDKDVTYLRAWWD